MKVILTEDVKSLGKKGEMVNASDGYARNYLFPRNLAKPASAQALNELKNLEASKKHKQEMEIANAKEIFSQIDGKNLKIIAKAGQNGRLFGSVTVKEIAEELKKQMGVTVDKRKLSIQGDLKTYGTYEAEVKLLQGITAKLYVVVGEK